MRDADSPQWRFATPDDAASVAALCTELGYPTTAEAMAERLGECGGDPERAVMLALSGTAVVGMIEVRLCRTLESGTWAEIVGLVVTEARRGRGTGAGLVAWAKDWARGQRVDRLRVRTNVVREDAATFYIRQGFREIKQQRVFDVSV